MSGVGVLGIILLPLVIIEPMGKVSETPHL
jgi:hypothetical protein